MRALLDANILISYLLNPDRDSATTRVLEAGVSGAFTLLVPEALLEEVCETVRSHEHLSRRISSAALEALIALVPQVGEVVPRITQPLPAVTRDRKDDYLMAYALVGRADCLVTGDADLLVLDGIDLGSGQAPLRILTAAAFWEML